MDGYFRIEDYLKFLEITEETAFKPKFFPHVHVWVGACVLQKKKFNKKFSFYASWNDFVPN